jgi:hypothetical protein
MHIKNLMLSLNLKSDFQKIKYKQKQKIKLFLLQRGIPDNHVILAWTENFFSPKKLYIFFC